jgi:hypothetical protein
MQHAPAVASKDKNVLAPASGAAGTTIKYIRLNTLKVNIIIPIPKVIIAIALFISFTPLRKLA